jgi:hypothetical protein
VVHFTRVLRTDEGADLLATAELAQSVIRRVINVVIIQVTSRDGPEARQTIAVPESASSIQFHENRASLAAKYGVAFREYLEATREYYCFHKL